MSSRLFSRVLAVCASLSLTQCYVDPAMMNPAYPGPGAPPRPGGGGGYDRTAFSRGTQDGRADHNAGLSRNHRRHVSRYTPITEDAYRNGYSEGYEDAHNPGHGHGRGDGGYGGGGDSARVYQMGQSSGRQDASRTYPADPGRHRGTYDPRQRSSFESGYYNGYGPVTPGHAPMLPPALDQPPGLYPPVRP